MSKLCLLSQHMVSKPLLQEIHQDNNINGLKPIIKQAVPIGTPLAQTDPYFYVMSTIFTNYTLSGKLIFNAHHLCCVFLHDVYCELRRNLIFYVRQFCIFLCDVIGVHLLWALGELELLCASVFFINDKISSHTPVITRNIHVILMLFIYIYISILRSTSLWFIMLSDSAYFHCGFSHGMCIIRRT